jgi:hypothetical protein
LFLSQFPLKLVHKPGKTMILSDALSRRADAEELKEKDRTATLLPSHLLDGAIEGVMQEIQAYLSIYCLSDPTEWIESIPLLEFVHNSRPHVDRKQSPFEIIMGYQPQGIPQGNPPSKVPSLEEQFEQITQ